MSSHIKIMHINLVVLCLLFNSNSSGSPLKTEVTICLTGTTVKQFPAYGRAFLNGARLAIKDSGLKRVKLKSFYYDRSPLAPRKALDAMANKGCTGIIGFSTGNDLIAIKDKAKTLNTFIGSIYADYSQELKSLTNLITLQASEEVLTKKLLNSSLPLNTGKNKKIFVVTAIDRSTMINYRNSLKKHLTKNVEYYSTTERSPNLRKIKNAIERSKADQLVLFTRSLLAAKIVDNLSVKKKKSIVIYGTKYFGSKSLPAFWNYLKDKDIKGYFFRQNVIEDEDFREFKKSYRDHFNEAPMVISAGSYDLVTFITQGLKAIINGCPTQPCKVSNGDLLKTLQSQSFQGLTGVKISPTLRTENTKSFLIRVNKTGYQVVK